MALPMHHSGARLHHAPQSSVNLPDAFIRHLLRGIDRDATEMGVHSVNTVTGPALFCRIIAIHVFPLP
jgi:hypothetical protein